MYNDKSPSHNRIHRSLLAHFLPTIEEWLDATDRHCLMQLSSDKTFTIEHDEERDNHFKKENKFIATFKKWGLGLHWIAHFLFKHYLITCRHAFQQDLL